MGSEMCIRDSPIIAIGLGEKDDDLQSFDAETFAENFLSLEKSI